MVNSKNDLAFIEQNKDQQQSHWLLNSLLPQGRSESMGTADNSPVRTREGARSPSSLPYSSNYDSTGSAGVIIPGTNDGRPSKTLSPQQKPVNLLPDVPAQNNRKLSEREQRDCDVIGMKRKIIIEFFFFFVKIMNIS